MLKALAEPATAMRRIGCNIIRMAEVEFYKEGLKVVVLLIQDDGH